MTQDPNKKTLRSFQCRDYLWDIFEQMSGELECSVDYLINEAMRQYARSRNYGTRPSQPPRPGSGPPMAGPQQQSGSIPSLNRGGARAPSAPPPPPGQGRQPSPAYGGYGGGSYPSPVQPAGYGPPPAGQMQPQHMPGPPQYPGGPPMAPQHGSSYPPGPTHRPPAPMQSPYQPQPQAPMPPMGGMGGMPAPPPLPGAGGYGQPMAGGMPRPTLFVIFNGQKIPVAKDEFVIGRGSKTADLPIKDGNISRRHAAIVYQDGAFWMKDLGSTNGVEYAGQRVDSKRIDEGDVFQLCDYELRFTYR